ncbi:peptidyl-prolyl cis-trans isomerase [Sphingosinicella terrae]|uniref:peptidyl-prolyl cis-trans isomerase n=1 Tax=Sphingosinicella terrae TaxID=2172047 RepID=UPI000E0D9CA9|nr:peptidyl-prolyl cis-trans isomerase [Sphingosinicella terrae]
MAATRRFRSWTAGAILFLALLAMVVTGFGTGGIGDLGSLSGGGSGTPLARAASGTLTEQEVNDVISREYRRARQERPDLGMAEFVGQAFTPIVDQLVLALAVQAFGQDQGLTVSDEMIDREIVNIPGFRNVAGQFDASIMRQALQAQNITEPQLRQDIARSLMQRQLLGPIARGAAVPEGLARSYADLLLERRRGTIGVVPTELLQAGIEPTDAEVTAFYQRARGRFVVPERRVIRYAMIGPEQVAAQVRATDQEIAAHYQQNAATYGPRETRDLQQIVLPDQAAAQRFVQAVRGGTSFVAAAQAAGFSEADISSANQTREQFAGITTPEVANAAFAAAQDAVVGPIRSPLGFHVARVEQINRSPARPLETVRAEIVQAIEQRKLAEALAGVVGRVEERIADGASLEEAAQSERLQIVTTPAITETGQSPDQPFTVPPELQPLLRSAFEIDAEDPEPVVEQIQPNQRYALVGIERVVPAAPPPLPRIRDQVRAELIQQRALERGRAIADQIAQRINGGMAPAEAFAQAQPRMPAPEALEMQRLDISRAGTQTPPPLLTLFSLPQGRAQVIPAPNGRGWFVVHHAQRTPGDASSRPELIATTRNEFTSSAAAEMAEQFARALERSAEVERNPEAIEAARRRLVGGLAE